MVWTEMKHIIFILLSSVVTIVLSSDNNTQPNGDAVDEVIVSDIDKILSLYGENGTCKDYYGKNDNSYTECSDGDSSSESEEDSTEVDESLVLLLDDLGLDPTNDQSTQTKSDNRKGTNNQLVHYKLITLLENYKLSLSDENTGKIPAPKTEDLRSNILAVLKENGDTSGESIDASSESIDTSGEFINTSGELLDTSGESIDTSGESTHTSGETESFSQLVYIIENEVINDCESYYEKNLEYRCAPGYELVGSDSRSDESDSDSAESDSDSDESDSDLDESESKSKENDSKILSSEPKCRRIRKIVNSESDSDDSESDSDSKSDSEEDTTDYQQAHYDSEVDLDTSIRYLDCVLRQGKSADRKIRGDATDLLLDDLQNYFKDQSKKDESINRINDLLGSIRDKEQQKTIPDQIQEILVILNDLKSKLPTDQTADIETIINDVLSRLDDVKATPKDDPKRDDAIRELLILINDLKKKAPKDKASDLLPIISKILDKIDQLKDSEPQDTDPFILAIIPLLEEIQNNLSKISPSSPNSDSDPVSNILTLMENLLENPEDFVYNILPQIDEILENLGVIQKTMTSDKYPDVDAIIGKILPVLDDIKQTPSTKVADIYTKLFNILGDINELAKKVPKQVPEDPKEVISDILGQLGEILKKPSSPVQDVLPRINEILGALGKMFKYPEVTKDEPRDLKPLVDSILPIVYEILSKPSSSVMDVSSQLGRINDIINKIKDNLPAEYKTSLVPVNDRILSDIAVILKSPNKEIGDIVSPIKHILSSIEELRKRLPLNKSAIKLKEFVKYILPIVDEIRQKPQSEVKDALSKLDHIHDILEDLADYLPEVEFPKISATLKHIINFVKVIRKEPKRYLQSIFMNLNAVYSTLSKIFQKLPDDLAVDITKELNRILPLLDEMKNNPDAKISDVLPLLDRVKFRFDFLVDKLQKGHKKVHEILSDMLVLLNDIRKSPNEPVQGISSQLDQIIILVNSVIELNTNQRTGDYLPILSQILPLLNQIKNKPSSTVQDVQALFRHILSTLAKIQTTLSKPKTTDFSSSLNAILAILDEMKKKPSENPKIVSSQLEQILHVLKSLKITYPTGSTETIYPILAKIVTEVKEIDEGRKNPYNIASRVNRILTSLVNIQSSLLPGDITLLEPSLTSIITTIEKMTYVITPKVTSDLANKLDTIASILDQITTKLPEYSIRTIQALLDKVLIVSKQIEKIVVRYPKGIMLAVDRITVVLNEARFPTVMGPAVNQTLSILEDVRTSSKDPKVLNPLIKTLFAAIQKIKIIGSSNPISPILDRIDEMLDAIEDEVLESMMIMNVLEEALAAVDEVTAAPGIPQPALTVLDNIRNLLLTASSNPVFSQQLNDLLSAIYNAIEDLKHIKDVSEEALYNVHVLSDILFKLSPLNPKTSSDLGVLYDRVLSILDHLKNITGFPVDSKQQLEDAAELIRKGKIFYLLQVLTTISRVETILKGIKVSQRTTYEVQPLITDLFLQIGQIKRLVEPPSPLIALLDSMLSTIKDIEAVPSLHSKVLPHLDSLKTVINSVKFYEGNPEEVIDRLDDIFGIIKDIKKIPYKTNDIDRFLNNIWSIVEELLPQRPIQPNIHDLLDRLTVTIKDLSRVKELPEAVESLVDILFGVVMEIERFQNIDQPLKDIFTIIDRIRKVPGLPESVKPMLNNIVIIVNEIRSLPEPDPYVDRIMLILKNFSKLQKFPESTKYLIDDVRDILQEAVKSMEPWKKSQLLRSILPVVDQIRSEEVLVKEASPLLDLIVVAIRDYSYISVLLGELSYLTIQVHGLPADVYPVLDQITVIAKTLNIDSGVTSETIGVILSIIPALKDLDTGSNLPKEAKFLMDRIQYILEEIRDDISHIRPVLERIWGLIDQNKKTSSAPAQIQNILDRIVAIIVTLNNSFKDPKEDINRFQNVTMLINQLNSLLDLPIPVRSLINEIYTVLYNKPTGVAWYPDTRPVIRLIIFKVREHPDLPLQAIPLLDDVHFMLSKKRLSDLPFDDIISTIAKMSKLPEVPAEVLYLLDQGVYLIKNFKYQPKLSSVIDPLLDRLVLLSLKTKTGYGRHLPLIEKLTFTFIQIRRNHGLPVKLNPVVEKAIKISEQLSGLTKSTEFDQEFDVILQLMGTVKMTPELPTDVHYLVDETVLLYQQIKELVLPVTDVYLLLDDILSIAYELRRYSGRLSSLELIEERILKIFVIITKVQDLPIEVSYLLARITYVVEMVRTESGLRPSSYFILENMLYHTFVIRRLPGVPVEAITLLNSVITLIDEAVLHANDPSKTIIVLDQVVNILNQSLVSSDSNVALKDEIVKLVSTIKKQRTTLIVIFSIHPQIDRFYTIIFHIRKLHGLPSSTYSVLDNLYSLAKQAKLLSISNLLPVLDQLYAPITDLRLTYTIGRDPNLAPVFDLLLQIIDEIRSNIPVSEIPEINPILDQISSLLDAVKLLAPAGRTDIMPLLDQISNLIKSSGTKEKSATIPEVQVILNDVMSIAHDLDRKDGLPVEFKEILRNIIGLAYDASKYLSPMITSISNQSVDSSPGQISSNSNVYVKPVSEQAPVVPYIDKRPSVYNTEHNNTFKQGYHATVVSPDSQYNKLSSPTVYDPAAHPKDPMATTLGQNESRKPDPKLATPDAGRRHTVLSPTESAVQPGVSNVAPNVYQAANTQTPSMVPPLGQNTPSATEKPKSDTRVQSPDAIIPSVNYLASTSTNRQNTLAVRPTDGSSVSEGIQTAQKPQETHRESPLHAGVDVQY